MAYNKIGFHASTPGNMKGYGDYVRALDAAGVPAVIMSVGGAGLGDVVAQWDAGSDVAHVACVRYMWPDGTQDVPPYGADPFAAAAAWWANLKPLVGAEVRRHRDKIWIKAGNELDRNQADWLGRFYVQLATIMHEDADGPFKLAAFSFASGEPEAEAWHAPGMLAYLRLCAERPWQAAVGLHEYSYDDRLDTGMGYMVGRFRLLHEACDLHGIARPPILIHEWGWRQDRVPPVSEGMAQLPAVAELYARHANILGAGLWTLQKWHSGIQDQVQQYIQPITNYAVQTRFPDPEPPEEPPMTNHKAIVVKAPQDTTKAEWLKIAETVYPLRHTLTMSHDDALTLLRGGNDDSFVKAAFPARDGDALALVEAAGYRYETLFPEEGPQPPPAASFRFTHWPTDFRVINQRFGANPQNYESFGLPGHDGTDVRAPHGSPLYAVAAGVVSDRREAATGHNYGRFIRIDHGSGWETTYAHCDRLADLPVGTAVAGGQVIAWADNTGNSFGSHLHLTLKRKGYSYVDAAGNVWPHNIHDSDPYLAAFSGVTWPAAPPPPTSPLIDMTKYFSPGAHDFGDISIKSTNWGQGDVRQQLQRRNGYLYVTKGHEFEQRMIDGGTIYFLLDDSPGGGKYYKVHSTSGWLPGKMRVGDVFQRQETATFFWRSNCQPTGESSVWSNEIRFVAHHATWTSPAGIVLSDVAVLEWWQAGQFEERYYLAPHLGYAGWQNRHGRESWIKELIPVGHQGNNTFPGACYHAAF